MLTNRQGADISADNAQIKLSGFLIVAGPYVAFEMQGMSRTLMCQVPTGQELAVRGKVCSVSNYRTEPVRNSDQIEKGERLLAEFRAIENWDRKFSSSGSAMESLGVLCRVRRRMEIVSELTALISEMKRKLFSQISQKRSGLPKSHIRPSQDLHSNVSGVE